MQQPSGNKLRFAIMSNGLSLKKWQTEAVLKIISGDITEPVLLIINNSIPEKKPFLKKLKALLFSNFFYKLYSRKLSKILMLQELPLHEKLADIAKIHCTTIHKGISEYFSDEDIHKIRSYKPDFILRFGFNIIRGEILNAATYGVWSFHHDDEQKYRGGPYGFWEIYHNDFVNGVIIQKLTEKLDAGIVLKKYFLKTILHSYKTHVNSLLESATEMPLQVCRDIVNNCADYFQADASTTKAPVFKAPSNLKMLIFLHRQFRNKLLFHYRELFRSEAWYVGVAKLPIAEIALGKNLKEFSWLKPSENGIFYADPFVYAINDKIQIIFEKYSYAGGRGNIAVSEFNGNSFSKADTLLAKEKHLAYPYAFQEENQVFCIPEESEYNRIALYRVNSTSGSLEFVQVLVDGIDAVDTTLVKFNEKYWLFFTRKFTDTNTKLHIYFSDAMLGPYFPHKNNPVKADIRSSRPGGTPFAYNGDLYRPAQDSSKHYGSGIVINKIVKLAPDEFYEEEAGRIRPEEIGSKLNGTHTISGFGEYTVVDVKKHRFIFQSFKQQLKRKIKKLHSSKKPTFEPESHINQ